MVTRMFSRRGSQSAAWACACVVTASVGLAPRSARAQERVPLCVPAEAHRLASGAPLAGGTEERIVALPFASPGPQGERFVVAVRDSNHALGAQEPERTAAAEAAFVTTGGLGMRTESGTAVMRLGADGARVGPQLFVPDPFGNDRGTEGSAPALPSGVTLPGGVLLVQLAHGELYATLVPPAGDVPAPQRVVAAPGTDPGSALAWFTLAPRGDGAVALAQNENGQVLAVSFDARGQARSAGTWSQHVGGPLQLLPSAGNGPLAALLGHPVEGAGPSGEQARVQELVPLDPNTLAPPANVRPTRTGFAQFPISMVRRDDRVTVIQWAHRAGFAVADFAARGSEFRVETPTVYPSHPAIEGEPAGHAAVLGTGGVVYDVALYEQLPGAGLVARLAWVPSPTQAAVRSDVLPLRLRPSAAPALLAAEDGVLVITAGNDETGGAVDAVHVRCDLVALPSR